MYLQKVISKTLFKSLFFVGILSATDRDTDPRIRIRTKLSRIHNTGLHNPQCPGSESIPQQWGEKNLGRISDKTGIRIRWNWWADGDWPDLLGSAGNMLADDGHESGAVRVLDDETDADNPARRHHLYERIYLLKKPVSEFKRYFLSIYLLVACTFRYR
jgi:hypothetical protein